MCEENRNKDDIFKFGEGKPELPAESEATEEKGEQYEDVKPPSLKNRRARPTLPSITDTYTEPVVDSEWESIPRETKEMPFFKIMTCVLSVITVCAVAFGGYTFVMDGEHVGEIANLEEKVASLEAEISEVRQEAADKDSEVNTSTKTITDLNKSLEELQTNYEKLESQNKKLRKKITAYEEERDNLAVVIGSNLNRSSYSYKSTYEELRATEQIGTRLYFDGTLLQDSTGDGLEILTVNFENKAVSLSYMADKVGIVPAANVRYRIYGTYEGRGEKDRPTILVDFLEVIE